MAAVVPLKAPKTQKGKEVVKPYEPTFLEAETLARYKKRKSKKIPAPCIKVDVSAEWHAHAKIEAGHPNGEIGFRLLSEALGTDDRHFVIGTLDSLASAVQDDKQVDQRTLHGSGPDHGRYVHGRETQDAQKARKEVRDLIRAARQLAAMF